MKRFSDWIAEASKLPFTQPQVEREIQKSIEKFLLKPGSPRQIANAVQKSLGRKYEFGFSVRLISELDKGDFSVYGFYSVEIDIEKNDGNTKDEPIELVLLHSPSDSKRFEFTPNGMHSFSRGVAEVLSHEFTHAIQARTRGFKEFRGGGFKKKYLYKVQNIDAGSYLAADDEIEAHAFNIAGDLLDYTKRDKKSAIQFLNRPKKGALQNHHLDFYLDVFGDSRHPVIKRLYKKVVFFLDQRERE